MVAASRRGKPWSEEEHKQFLIGLKLFGRGDWRSVSHACIKTRTPAQIASHAQKYFQRQEVKAAGMAPRRASIHDISSIHDQLPPRKKRSMEKPRVQMICPSGGSNEMSNGATCASMPGQWWVPSRDSLAGISPESMQLQCSAAFGMLACQMQQPCSAPLGMMTGQMQQLRWPLPLSGVVCPMPIRCGSQPTLELQQQPLQQPMTSSQPTPPMEASQPTSLSQLLQSSQAIALSQSMPLQKPMQWLSKPVLSPQPMLSSQPAPSSHLNVYAAADSLLELFERGTDESTPAAM